MSLKTKLLAACGGLATVPAIEDYFSAYTYTGNGSTQTIVNGIDLAGKGGMVWNKNRDVGGNVHLLCDTVRGVANVLSTNGIAQSASYSDVVTSVSPTGFVLGSGATLGTPNVSGVNYVAWSFAQGQKFFKVATVTVSGSNQTVDLSALGAVGMVTVKRTDNASDWYTWHKDLTAGNLVYLSTTAAQAASAAISVSGTTLTLTQATIGNGTYIVYAWAHDTSAGGMIQCGSYTDPSGLAVTLGWEPQYILAKPAGAGTWFVLDTSRGLAVTDERLLYPSTSATEYSFLTVTGTTVAPNAIGFTQGATIWGGTMIYLAIRRGPMKAPTVGTQVFSPTSVASTTPNTFVNAGFPVDMVIGSYNYSGLISFDGTVFDRLRGGKSVNTNSTAAEVAMTVGFDYIPGFSTPEGTGNTNIWWNFRRAPGVFDGVCYTGTGVAKTEAHNLGVAPELMIVKNRSGADGWYVTGDAFAVTEDIILNSTAAKLTNAAARWNSTRPTAAVFSVGTGVQTNQVSNTYVAYLFATLAGISKVGSYTGNGTSQTINCGFTTGARFILIKCTSSMGDWFVWDSTRGIVAGNDPHLSLNTTNAEVTTDDSIDPDASGFIVNELAATHVNVNAAAYIYLSLS